MPKPAILLVDDEDDLLQVMRAAIERALPDHEVVAAATLEDALDEARALAALGRPLAGAVVDHVLGGRTGLDLLEELRQLQPALPALLVTGRADAGVEERAAQLGAKILWKPARLAQLVAEVRALLGR